MKPYRIKHKPSGYYWAPGGKLSKIGKVFTDETKDILAKVHQDSNSTEDYVCIYMVTANSPVFKTTQGIIDWVEDKELGGGLYHAEIPKDEFIREEIATGGSYKVKHKKSGLYYAGNFKLNGKGKYYAGDSVLDEQGDVLVIDDSKTHTTYELTKDILDWERNIDGCGKVYYRVRIPKSEFEKERV